MYERLVGVIHRHRSWIGIIEWDKTYAMQAVTGDTTRTITCRMLVLYAKQPRGVYRKGQTWNVPEHMLDRAVNALKQRNPGFKARWKAGTILPDDAEFIVSHATNGFINLNLKSNEQLKAERNGQMD